MDCETRKIEKTMKFRVFDFLYKKSDCETVLLLTSTKIQCITVVNIAPKD